MAASAGTVTLDLDANSVKLIRELQKAQTQTRRSAYRMRADIKQSFAMMGKAVVAFGATLAATSKLSIDFADKIGKTADKLGIGVEALQEYRFAASQAGVAQNTFDMAIQRFTRRAAEAANGTGEAKAALAELGIQLTDGHGRIRKTEDLLKDVADALSQGYDPAERLRIAFKLFDSEGVAMVNMLKDGSKGLDEASQKARDLGLVLREDLVRNAEDAANKMDQLQKVLQVRIAAAVTENADSIIVLTDALIKFVGMIGKATKGWNDWLAVQGVGVDSIDEIRQRGNALLRERQHLESQLEGNFAAGTDSRYRIVNWIFGGSEEENRKAIQERIDAINAEMLALQDQAKTIQTTGQNAPIQIPEKRGLGGVPALLDIPAPTPIAGPPMDKHFIETRNAMESEYASLLASTRTQQEQINAEVARAGELYEAGIIPSAEEYTDIVRRIGERWVEANEKVDEMTQFAVQAARQMQSAFADFLFDPFEDGMKGMLKGFANTIRRMAADLAASQLLNALFGSMAGSSSGWLASLGSAFLGGARASGGPISAGSAYLVGERGPELIVPNQSGMVIPNDAMGGVVVNIDARETDNPGRLLSLVPIIQSQVEQSIEMKRRRGYF